MRYGAFPSDTTWYVAAGDWPSNAATSLSASQRGKSQFVSKDGHVMLNRTRNVGGDASSSSGSGSYIAEIAVVGPRRECLLWYQLFFLCILKMLSI